MAAALARIQLMEGRREWTRRNSRSMARNLDHASPRGACRRAHRVVEPSSLGTALNVAQAFMVDVGRRWLRANLDVAVRGR